MEGLRIIIQRKYQDIILTENVKSILSSKLEGVQINFFYNNGKIVSLGDGLQRSGYDLIEESIINNEADLTLLPLQDLPYPLNDQLSVVALLAADGIISNHMLPQDKYVALVAKKDRADIQLALESMDVRKKWGSVVLAGFGPGDTSLITKKAEYHLHRSEVIFYDDLVNEEYLRPFCAQKIYVGKRKGKHEFDQEKINELMYQEAIKGKWVVRIKGGDPLIFGRGAEEYHYLKRRQVGAEIVPGISSAFAAASQAIIPFTERSLASSVVFLSGHDLFKLKIPKADTLVFYMGASNQQELADKIIDEGWPEDTPVGVVHNASNTNQKIYRGDLKDLSKNGSGLPSPSIIFVGKTAGEYTGHQNKWLYTGASLEEVKMSAHLVHTPLISIQANVSNNEIQGVLNNFSSYQRIVFTSRYAVHHFFNKLFEAGKDVRNLYGIHIDSIGKTTSRALKEKGLIVHPLSKEESIEGLLNIYGKERIAGEDILIPCSNQSTGTLQKGLRRLGNRVKTIEVYEVVKNKAIIKQNLTHFQGLVFSSPATVEAFFEVYGNIPSHLKVKCRGLQTQRMLQKFITPIVDVERSAV